MSKTKITIGNFNFTSWLKLGINNVIRLSLFLNQYYAINHRRETETCVTVSVVCVVCGWLNTTVLTINTDKMSCDETSYWSHQSHCVRINITIKFCILMSRH